MEAWNLLLTDWQQLTWQAETGGPGWGREGGSRVNYGWTRGRREEGVSGEGSRPADRQAASWWSHLATQSQPEMMGHLRICKNCTVALFSPEGLWDGCRQRDSTEESEAACFEK